MEPMLRPMTVLWTRRAAVMWTWGASPVRGSRRAPWSPGRAERMGVWGPCRGPQLRLVVRWVELHHEVRDPVFHLGEGHGIDDLIADAVVVLAAEVRLAPEVL